MIYFDLANSWLEYKRDCQLRNIPKNKVIYFLHFRFDVTNNLIMAVRPIENVRKTGRPSSACDDTLTSSKTVRRDEERPIADVQFDNVDHMPLYDNNKEPARCKMARCKQHSHIFCQKCKVHLCLVKNRNCFVNFNRK